MTRQPPFAGDDTVPYDRELIRSGDVGRATAARRRDGRRAPRDAWGPRSRRRGRSALRSIVMVVMVAILVPAGLLLVRAAAFNMSVSRAPFPSVALLGLLGDGDRVNVLMIGYGGEGHEGAYLADSIQVLSIDPSTDTTTTVPIPRDFWIEGVAAFPQNGKVNEVFATGVTDADGNGPEAIDAAGDLMAEVLSDVTGLEVEHWLSIDFAGFQEMVDAVGGVTIDNPVAFDYTLLPQEHAVGVWDDGGFAAGEIHLDGEQALAYARARYTSVVAESNDFARSVRQGRILAALRAELGSGGIGAIPPGLSLMDAMEGRVRTDLSAIDLFLLSGHLASDRRVELSEGPVLTATTNTNGQYILIPSGWTGPGDYGGLRSYLATELAAPTGSSAADAP